FTPLRERLTEERRERWSMIFRVMANGIVFRDPPEHTRLRALLSKAFTRGAVDQVRPWIQILVDELIDRMEQRGQVDLVRDFAYPLPVTVIARLIGAPTSDNDRIKAWSDDIATVMLGAVETADRHDRANDALGEMAEYFRGIVRDRRRAPRDDLASALVEARD